MTDSSQNLWLGMGLVALAAICFAATSASAVIAYEGSANPTAVITVRFLGGIILLWLMLKFTGARMSLPARNRWLAFGLGVGLAVQSFFLYASFELIPIGLTMVIFYVYPLMVAVVESLTGREKISKAIWGALFVAFGGLLLVFNVAGGAMNTQGAIYALIAGLTWGAITILSSRILKGGDALVLSLHMQIGALFVFLLICLFTLDVVLPNTIRGWAGFIALPVSFTIAITAIFAAITVIGSVRASLFMNIEPVVTIFFGFVILGQVLTFYQLLGAACVISAIIAVRWEGFRKASEE